MNLYKNLPANPGNNPEEINVVVDIPKGSSNKYEYSEDGGYFALDRVLHHQMFYPFDYGFVPQTHAGDGDAVDVVLLVTYPTFPGCVIKARIIGGIKTSDEAGEDNKIIAVPVSKLDPRFNETNSVDDLPKHVQKELLLHFKEIKKLEEQKYDKVKIGGFLTKKEAITEVETAKKNYQN